MKPTAKIFTIFACLMASNWGLRAQVPLPPKQDFELLERAFRAPPRQRLTERFADSQKNSNELQAVFSGLFLFYKSFFSSQDRNRCSFHPSCSEFGLQAVKRLGVVRGGICTFDRLSRCNGLNAMWYEKDALSKHLLDPVEW